MYICFGPQLGPQWFRTFWGALGPPDSDIEFLAIFEFFHDINKKNLENWLAVDFEDASFDVKHMGSKMALR